NNICAFARPSPLYGGGMYVGSILSFENCVIERFRNIDAPALILENDSLIENLIFNGFGLKNEAGSSPIPGLLNIGSGFSRRVLAVARTRPIENLQLSGWRRQSEATQRDHYGQFPCSACPRNEPLLRQKPHLRLPVNGRALLSFEQPPKRKSPDPACRSGH